MDKIVGIFSAAPSLGDRRDDNFVDRLSSRYTVVILIASAILVSASMYVGSPITCWAPVHFTGSHTKFTNSYCWVRNTYYLPWEEQVPREGEERKVIPYYQWIPFILLGQAIFFYIPKIVWNGLNQKVGVDADNILDAASSITKSEGLEHRGKLLTMITQQLDRCLSLGSRNQDKGQNDVSKVSSTCGQTNGNYLTLLYLFSKLLYIANVAFQLFMLNQILSTEFSVYGIEVISYILKGHDWTEAPYVAFPRVTFCDFNVRRLGNVHRYTVQCLLPINMYNEKIYMFLWFWMVFVALASVLDLLTWLARFLSRGDKIKFISTHLNFVKNEDIFQDTRGKIEKFVDEYLKQDGVFLLRLIGQNTCNVTVTDITDNLWDRWDETPNDVPPKSVDDVAEPFMCTPEEAKEMEAYGAANV